MFFFYLRRRQRCTTQVAVDPRNDFAVVDLNRSLLLVICIMSRSILAELGAVKNVKCKGLNCARVIWKGVFVT